MQATLDPSLAPAVASAPSAAPAAPPAPQRRPSRGRRTLAALGWTGLVIGVVLALLTGTLFVALQAGTPALQTLLDGTVVQIGDQAVVLDDLASLGLGSLALTALVLAGTVVLLGLLAAVLVPALALVVVAAVAVPVGIAVLAVGIVGLVLLAPLALVVWSVLWLLKP